MDGPKMTQRLSLQDFRDRAAPDQYVEPDAYEALPEAIKAIVSPKDVALTIDGIYGEDISRFSLAGRDYAEANSWAALKPRYAKVLEELL